MKRPYFHRAVDMKQPHTMTEPFIMDFSLLRIRSVRTKNPPAIWVGLTEVDSS